MSKGVEDLSLMAQGSSWLRRACSFCSEPTEAEDERDEGSNRHEDWQHGRAEEVFELQQYTLKP